MKRNKVLILSHIMPPGVDGGSKILSQLAKVWKKKSKQIKIITTDAYSTDDFISPEKRRLPKGEADIDKIETIRLKTNRRLYKFFGLLKKLSFIPLLKAFFSLIQTGPVIRLPINKVKNYKPDLIIAGVYPTLMPVYGWMLSKLTGAKLGLIPCFHPDDGDFYRWPLIRILQKADFIYALTKFEKKFYVSQLGIDDEKIIIFTPWVSEGLKLSPEDKIELSEIPTLVFLGVQSAHKRIDWLIEAFKRLQQSDQPLLKQLRLIIAGKETLHTPEIRNKLQELPKEIQEKIEFLGEFSEEEEKKILDQAWLLINPSEHESLGLVFLEAWSRKKPVIAANLKGLTDLIEEGKTGFLFDRDNINDLVDKIKKALENRKKIIDMGENGYQKVVEEFSKDAVFRRFEN